MSQNFFAIGHITNDLKPSPHVGGGVTYSSVVAKRLGMQPHVITKCPKDSPYIKELEDMGIQVHLLPVRDHSFDNSYTSFENIYDNQGKRTQMCPQRQEDITLADLPNFPDIPKDSEILLAPVVGEIDAHLFSPLSQIGRLSLIPQGYFRKIDEQGVVTSVPLQDLSFFSFSQITILSNEDIAFGEKAYMEKLRKVCPVIIETQGENGSTIFPQNQNPIAIQPYPLQENEIIDLTGAGDCYAASLLVKLSQGETLHTAGIFASLFAALKIAGVGGRGVGLVTIPTKEEVNGYINANEKRINDFYKSSQVKV